MGSDVCWGEGRQRGVNGVLGCAGVGVRCAQIGGWDDGDRFLAAGCDLTRPHTLTVTRLGTLNDGWIVNVDAGEVTG